MAILLHPVLNAPSRLGFTMPKYSVEPPSAAEAAQTVHVNLMGAIVVGVAAVAVVLVYGPRNLSRGPKQVLSAASAESRKPTTSARVR